MARRFAILFFSLALTGCGREEPAPIVVKDEPTGPKDEPAPKVEPKKELPKKAPPVETTTVDLRPYGLFALVDLPKGTRIDNPLGKVIFIGKPEGAELIEGALNLAKIKEEWANSAEFKLKSIVVDQEKALLAEVESAGRQRFLVRVNVSIGGKDYHLNDYFRFEMVSLEEARRIIAWAGTIRQTPALKLAQDQRDAALRNAVAATARLEWRGAVFATPQNVIFTRPVAVDDAVCELLQAIPALESLTFMDAQQVTQRGIALLEELPRLRHLSITGPGVNGLAVQAVSHLSRLEALVISGAPLTDGALKPLGNLKKLVYLDLTGTRLSDNGLLLAKGLPDLQALNLEATEVTGPGLTLLKECKTLTKLSLADTAVGDAAVPHLLALPGLTEIDLSQSELSDAGLEALAAHPALKKVHLYGSNVTAEGVAKLKKSLAANPLFKDGMIDLPEDEEPAPAAVAPPVPFDKLPPADPDALVAKFSGKITRDDEAVGKPIVSIDLHSKMLTDADLANLRGLTKLQNLNLEGCTGITDAGLAYLADDTALEAINLQGTKVRGDGLAHFQKMTRLKKLALSPDTRLTGPQLKFLAALPELEVVSFTVAEPAYPKLRLLAKMPNLKEVNLGDVQLSNRKLTILKGLKNLEGLRLSDKGRLGDRGLATLKDFPNLKTLSIPLYSGSNAGLDPFRLLGNLESLALYGPFITDGGLGGLAACSKLERVQLDRMKIGDAALLPLLNLNKLLAVSLSETLVTDRGVETLAKLKDLEAIDLTRTKITDAGLAKLQEMDELRVLMLNGTAITGAGFKGNEMKRLIHLALNETKLNDAGLSAIGQLSSALRTLDVAGTEITSAGLASLRPLRNLAALDLDDCSLLNDDAVSPLKELRNLKSVSLRRTKLTKGAMESLRNAQIQVDTGSFLP